MKSAYSSAAKSLQNAEKSLKKARAGFKSAIAALEKGMKAQAAAVNRINAASRSSSSSKKSVTLLSQAKSAMARMKTAHTTKGRTVWNKLSSSQRRQLKAIGKLVAAGKSSAARNKIQSLVKGMPKSQAKAMDVNGLIQAVLRES